MGYIWYRFGKSLIKYFMEIGNCPRRDMNRCFLDEFLLTHSPILREMISEKIELQISMQGKVQGNIFIINR